MGKRELKRLGRKELLQLLLEQTEANEKLADDIRALHDENTRLREQLREQEVRVTSSGTLAEASLKLAGVFDAADEAARIFLSGVEQTHEIQQRELYEMQQRAREHAARIMDDAQTEAARVRKSADDYWRQMMDAAFRYRTTAPAAPIAPEELAIDTDFSNKAPREEYVAPEAFVTQDPVAGAAETSPATEEYPFSATEGTNFFALGTPKVTLKLRTDDLPRVYREGDERK